MDLHRKLTLVLSFRENPSLISTVNTVLVIMACSGSVLFGAVDRGVSFDSNVRYRWSGPYTRIVRLAITPVTSNQIISFFLPQGAKPTVSLFLFTIHCKAHSTVLYCTVYTIRSLWSHGMAWTIWTWTTTSVKWDSCLTIYCKRQSITVPITTLQQYVQRLSVRESICLSYDSCDVDTNLLANNAFLHGRYDITL